MKNMLMKIILTVLVVLTISSCTSRAPSNFQHKDSEKKIPSFSKKSVKSVINSHLGEVVECYKSIYEKEIYPQGEIHFQWNIILTGETDSVIVKQSTFPDDKLADCIELKISTWKFPIPIDENTIISYPFFFG